MIIGGEDPDVGLGGYLTGGGHSPISGHYGLAADNILEFEVVTPAGKVEILNQCTNTDLFFAFRGVGTPFCATSHLYVHTNNWLLRPGRQFHLRRNPICNLRHSPHLLPLLVSLYHNRSHPFHKHHYQRLLARNSLLPLSTPAPRKSRYDGLLQHQLPKPLQRIHAPRPRRWPLYPK